MGTSPPKTFQFFEKKKHFHDSVSRQIKSFRVDWTPLSRTAFAKISSVVHRDPPPKIFLSFFEKKMPFHDSTT